MTTYGNAVVLIDLDVSHDNSGGDTLLWNDFLPYISRDPSCRG